MPDYPNSWHDPAIIDQETGDDLRQIEQRRVADAERAEHRAAEGQTTEETTDA